MNTCCYLCKIILNSHTESKEHILLNSIGGRLKSKKLLCRTCNSNFGHDADNELANQLSFLSSLLQIKREKGSNPIIKGAKTKSGVVYNIVGGSKPVLAMPKFEKKEENGKITYAIIARDIKESMNILKGLKKKHPELDLESVKQKMIRKEEYLDEALTHNLSIGGDLSFKSIAKTAVNFYIHTQNEIEHVNHLFPYLKGELDLKIVKHFYPSKSIYKKESNEVVHLIHLFGNKYNRLLYCFIEFFSSYSFFVLLSDNYQGKNISSTYCYDVLKNLEVPKQVNLKLKSEVVSEIYKMSKNDFEKITQKLHRVLEIANKIQVDQEISKLTKRAVDKVFEKYKHEPKITEQMINEFSQEIAHAYVRFAIRGQKK